MAKGCHQLIREGATLVESIEHIMEALQGWKHGYNLVEEVETSQTHSTHSIINLSTPVYLIGKVADSSAS